MYLTSCKNCKKKICNYLCSKFASRFYGIEPPISGPERFGANDTRVYSLELGYEKEDNINRIEPIRKWKYNRDGGYWQDENYFT